MAPSPSGSPTANGTNRLISHLAALERLTGERRDSRTGRLEAVLGTSTARLALAATGCARRPRSRAF